MLHEAAAVASGYDFLKYKHNGKNTCSIRRGEMDSASIKKDYSISKMHTKWKTKIEINFYSLQR